MAETEGYKVIDVSGDELQDKLNSMRNDGFKPKEILVKDGGDNFTVVFEKDNDPQVLTED